MHDHSQRAGSQSVCAGAGAAARPGAGAPRIAAAAYAADVADQRDLGHLRGRRDSHFRLGRIAHAQPSAGLHRRNFVDHQHRRRIPDHRQDAENVQEEGDEVTDTAVTGGVWQAAYIFAALTIVLSIKWLSSPVTARRGVLSGEIGLLLAIIGTLLRHEVISYEWILISMALGAAIGAPLAYLMPMTAVPQL